MKNFIKLCIINVVCVPMLFATNAFAAEKPLDSYLFIKDWIVVCSYLDSSVERFKTRQENLKENDDAYLAMQTMKDFQTAIYDIEKARQYLDAYKSSENKVINASSQAMLMTLDLLTRNYQETIKFFEVLYSPPKKDDNPSAGKIMSQISKLVADRDDMLRMCIDASVMATYALVSDKEDKEGHLSYLAITSQERDDLKKDLEHYFGKDIKVGIKAGQELSFAPAATLYEFLKKDFTPTDKQIQ